MKLFIDMDGTIAKWQEVPYLEKLSEEGYYRNLPPMQNVIDNIKSLCVEGLDCYTLSAYLPNSEFARDEKNQWLDENLPEIDLDHRLWVPYGENKSEFIGTEISYEDYLLDDYTKNLVDWRTAGGTGIKLINGINDSNRSWSFDRVIHNSPTLCDEIKNIMQNSLEQDVTSTLNEINMDDVPGIKI